MKMMRIVMPLVTVAAGVGLATMTGNAPSQPVQAAMTVQVPKLLKDTVADKYQYVLVTQKGVDIQGLVIGNEEETTGSIGTTTDLYYHVLQVHGVFQKNGQLYYDVWADGFWSSFKGQIAASALTVIDSKIAMPLAVDKYVVPTSDGWTVEMTANGEPFPDGGKSFHDLKERPYHVKRLYHSFNGDYYELSDKKDQIVGYVLARNVVEVAGPPKVRYVNYVPGYGIAIWTSPYADKQLVMDNGQAKVLLHGGAYKYFKTEDVNGQTWYNLGGNQWLDGKYLSVDKPTDIVNPNDTGKLQINYVPGYGIAIWQDYHPNSKYVVGSNGKAKVLQHGMRYKYLKSATLNGHKWYNLGGNQWLDSKYAKPY